MTFQDRFAAVFDQVLAQDAAAREHVADRERPNAIARSVCEVLRTDGAAIGLAYEQRRMPLGSNNNDAALAESLEFTAGAGPCLEAMQTGLVVDAPAYRLAERWPVLSGLWREQTPFRSAASLPLVFPGVFSGMLNLFFRHDEGAQTLDVANLKLTELHVTQLVAEWVGRHRRDVSTALRGSQAVARAQVSVAIGMVVAQTGANGLDALAVIRAFAFSHELTIDEVSDRLISGDLATTDVIT